MPLENLMPRLLLLPLLLSLTSCGGPYRVAPVSGRITLNGEPLDHAAITFQPVARKDDTDPGPGSGAFTNAQGRYRLVLVGREIDGAIVGKHKVRVTLTDDAVVVDRANKRIEELPEKYNKQTTLEFDVPPNGSSSADFDLTLR